MKTIYLAGAGWEFDYRKDAISKYGEEFELIDPIGHSNELFKSIGFNMTVEEIFSKQNKTKKNCLPAHIRSVIVRNDKKHIYRSDYLIAYVEKATFGTVMEIHFAYENRIPVFVVNPNMDLTKDVWLSVHTTEFFNTVDDCIEFIRRLELKNV